MTAATPPDPAGGRFGVARLLSDERLVRRATEGDRRALEEIYRRYHQDLYRFCLAVVGNPQDAQDALQNTMVKVLRALPGEQRRIELKPWLYRIARNESVEAIRRRRDGLPLDSEQAAAAEEISATVEARERLRALIGDLEELPERQRAALVMRELAGFDFAEIGAAFETSGAVARQTVYEARLSLRQMEAGREMSCEAVMRELSEADGRVARRRELRAHLRSCASCRAFRGAIAARRGELAAIAPLPAAASAALLDGALAGAASAGAGAGAGGGLAGAIGAGAGKTIAASALAKSAATVAVVAAVGVTAADRGGLVDVPTPGRGGSETSSPAASPAGAGGPAGGSAPSSGGSEGDGASAAEVTVTEEEVGANEAHPTGAKGRGASDRVDATRPTSEHAGEGAATGQPGGPHGHGPPASPGSAHSDGLPEAAEQGQQTAASNKPPQANASPSTPRVEKPTPPPRPSPPRPPVQPPPAGPPAGSSPTLPGGPTAEGAAGATAEPTPP